MLQTIINFNDMFEGIIDKENSLTFQNISQTMKINRSRKNGLCPSPQDRTVKYGNTGSEYLCTGTREVGRTTGIDDFSKNQLSHSHHSKLSLLQDVYQKAQERIQQYIRIYNCRYQKLLEAITDMQIRDLITFNRKFQENRILHKRLKEELPNNCDRFTLTNVFACEAAQPIFQHIDDLIFEISSTRNQQKQSRIRSRMASPQPISKKSSPQPLAKNLSEIIDPDELKLDLSNTSFQGQSFRSKNKSRQSFAKSQSNTGSQQSKSSIVQQNKKSVLEDTPESVKIMVNQNGIRVTNNMATTMFQKIDICESINMVPSEGTSNGNGSVCSLRRKNRYEEGSQQ